MIQDNLEIGSHERELFEREDLINKAEAAYHNARVTLMEEVEVQRTRLSSLLQKDNASVEQTRFLLLLDQFVMLDNMRCTNEQLQENGRVLRHIHDCARRKNPK